MGRPPKSRESVTVNYDDAVVEAAKPVRVTRSASVSDVEKRKQERLAALEKTVGSIERQFGKGSIMRLGDGAINREVEAVSTGSISVDEILGIGGFARGRIIEIYGPESSGKTTLALQTIAQGQKNGLIAAFIDAEHALDPVYAEKLGVVLNDVFISQPDNGEQALEITSSLCESGNVDIIVVDSVAALVPRAEIEGDMGDSHVGLQARLMSQALRKLTGVAARNNVMIIFINQLRMKIGVMYGNPETTTGGNALKFYASMRIDIRKVGQVKKGEDIIGSTTRIKVVKNKLAPPFKQADVDVLFGLGIDKFFELIDLGVKLNIIEKSGSWYSYDGIRIGQGKDNSRAFLIENPDVSHKIESLIRNKGNDGSAVIAESFVPNDDEQDEGSSSNDSDDPF